MRLQLLDPWLLALAVVVIPLVLWYRYSHARREGRVRFSTLGILAQLPATPRVSWRPAVDALRVLAILCVVLALARPAAVRTAEAAPAAGIDLALALDISGSMSERDLGPKDRLETAKDVVQDFLASREGDRIGLVAFAGEAVEVSPLTQDYNVLLGLLVDMTLNRIGGGTSVGNGLATAVNLVHEGKGKSRVVILLTDGRSTGGSITPEQATRLAQSLKIRVYTIGVGAVVNTPSEGRGRFRDLDEDELKRIAAATGGLYFRATDQQGLKQVYQTIDQLEKTALGTRVTVEVQDLSPIALLAGALLLMLEIALRNTVFRRAS